MIIKLVETEGRTIFGEGGPLRGRSGGGLVQCVFSFSYARQVLEISCIVLQLYLTILYCTLKIQEDRFNITFSYHNKKILI